MAQIDTSIYGPLLQPSKSLIGYSNELDQADLNRAQLQGARINLIGQQQDFQDQQKLRQLYAQPGFDPSKPESLPDIYKISPKAGMAAQKSMLDAQKTQADIGKTEADTKLSVENAQKLKLQHAIDVQGQLAQAAGAATDQASWDRGLQIAQALGVDVSSVPKVFDPATAQAIAKQAMTGAQQLDAHFKQITANETARHYKAEEGIQVRGQNMADSRAQQQIQKDYAVAGVAPDGGLSPQMETMAQGIAKGEIAPLSGFALSRPGGQALMGRVMQINPEYDATTYGAKAQAAKSFATGKQGDALRSVATANMHLSQLGDLVDPLNNDPNQTVNKVKNIISAWNGGTAPTNFDAVKNVIGQEVVKAIVAGGGSAGERDEAAKAFSTANSPAQLKGAIEHYRMIMGAQQTNLLEQRRAAGLSDSTLPQYSRSAPASPAAPTGFKITHIDGKAQ
jgi:hypothetical protein